MIPLTCDIEISNGYIYKKCKSEISTESIENQIKGFSYKGEKRVKDYAVERAMLPPFAYSFYSYIFENQAIPSPDEFIEKYLSQEYFTKESDDEYRVLYKNRNVVLNKEGLIARILRAYPSLLRDVHFYYMADESNLFEETKYSFNDDYSNGIDIQVMYKGQWYDVALLQNTRRSMYFKNEKKRRHGDLDLDLIYMEIDRKESKACGDFNLFTEKHINKLFETVKERAESSLAF